MQHEAKKVTKIVDELMTSFLMNDATTIETKVEYKPDKAIITMSVAGGFSDSYMRKLESCLMVPRQKEAEAYFWQLAGVYDCGDEMQLVGVMTDNVQISRDDKVHITIERWFDISQY